MNVPVFASRVHEIGRLQVDGNEVVEGTVPGNLRQLNIDNSNIYIGW